MSNQFHSFNISLTGVYNKEATQHYFVLLINQCHSSYLIEEKIDTYNNQQKEYVIDSFNGKPIIDTSEWSTVLTPWVADCISTYMAETVCFFKIKTWTSMNFSLSFNDVSTLKNVCVKNALQLVEDNLFNYNKSCIKYNSTNKLGFSKGKNPLSIFKQVSHKVPTDHLSPIESVKCNYIKLNLKNYDEYFNKLNSVGALLNEVIKPDSNICNLVKTLNSSILGNADKAAQKIAEYSGKTIKIESNADLIPYLMLFKHEYLSYNTNAKKLIADRDVTNQSSYNLIVKRTCDLLSRNCYEELKDKVDSCIYDIIELKKQVGRIDGLKSEVNGLNQRIDGLNQRIDAQQIEINELRADNQKLIELLTRGTK